MNEENNNNTEEQNVNNQAQEQTQDADTTQRTEQTISANAQELNDSVDSDEQVELNSQIQQDGSTPLRMPSYAPVSYSGENTTAPSASNLELADGTNENVAIDSSLQYDAINPEGNAQINFMNGNYSQLAAIPQKVSTKIATIQKTIIPLVEVALIELLGNNKAYKETSFNSVYTVDTNNEPKFECQMVYTVELFIGTDIDQEDIAEDAKYILDRVSVVPGVQWTKCEIDCTSGNVNINFTI